VDRVGWRWRLRCAPGQAGVALLEVLIGSVIVGIGAVGMALMLSNGQTFVGGEGTNRVALYLASQRIEEIRAIGFGAATANPTGSTGAAWVVENPPNCSPVAPATVCTGTAHPRYARLTSVVCVDRDNFAVRVACPTPAVAKLISVIVFPMMSNPSVFPAPTYDPVLPDLSSLPADNDPKARPVVLQSVIVKS